MGYRENLQKKIAKITVLFFPFEPNYPDFHVSSKVIANGRVNEFTNCLPTSWPEQLLNAPFFQVLFCLVFINVYLKMSSFASYISFILYASCLRKIFQRITEFQ